MISHSQYFPISQKYSTIFKLTSVKSGFGVNGIFFEGKFPL